MDRTKYLLDKARAKASAVGAKIEWVQKEGCPSFVQDWGAINGNKCGFPDGCDYSPANFFLATGRANAFVGPCPLLAITLP